MEEMSSRAWQAPPSRSIYRPYDGAVEGRLLLNRVEFIDSDGYWPSKQAMPDRSRWNPCPLSTMDPEMKKALCPGFANTPVPELGRSISVNAKWAASRTPRSFVTSVPRSATMVSWPE